MPGSLIVWILTALIITGVLTQRWWEPRLLARGVDVNGWPLRWWLTGYPRVVLRLYWTWRRLCLLNNMSVSNRSNQRLIGRDTVVQGQALRPKPPRLGWPTPTRTGLVFRVRLHPGQTPAPYLAAARAMEHTWRVHGVRVTSPRRGQVLVRVTALDPLTGDRPARQPGAAALLSADVGRVEDGERWLIDLRRVPHWLVTGATQSGKSSLLAALIKALSPQRVALVGIDCKGGMELGPFGGRFEALAIDRGEAIVVLQRMLFEIKYRMRLCRAEGVRSVWRLPEAIRPVPIVVIVDELAELYLTDGSREGREESEQCGTLLLRLAQLGAALGVHLVLAGQRVGSDLGPRVTSLRAQLGGRIAHRAHDQASAEMTLGDLNADAVIVAQTISEEEQGVAVVATSGRWVRARSHQVALEEVEEVARTRGPVHPFLSTDALLKGGGAA
ncbi:FtsK/SpoIIIE domain-containing protein [Streptomyces sp. BA2]|uniref:FtsK/SpoIIIE domain-containing protein n=1 Tax=Streptomyces sp. BA2 TaxID=436595 RepID=UPI00132A9826|nr:FtsK/SpoIIIE domain-containing protein [Streptomyces sp. BA2]MWA12066.1 cell division protein FtsK [Streptomyces sp. BA2]